MRKILLGIFAFISMTASVAIYKLGFFKPIIISIEKYPETSTDLKTPTPLNLIYLNHVGPYHKIVKTIEIVEKWAAENKVDCRRSFGLYLDDPEIVEHDRLKSKGGCVVKDLPSFPLPEGFETLTLPQKEYIIARFNGSPAIGPFKVYNQVEDFFSQHHWRKETAVMEIYERLENSSDSMNTLYLFSQKTPY